MTRWLCGALFVPPLFLTVWLAGFRWLLDENADDTGAVEFRGLLLSVLVGAVCLWRVLPPPALARAAVVLLYAPFLLVALFVAVLWAFGDGMCWP